MLGKLWNLLPLPTLHGYENPELVDVVFQKTAAYIPTEPWPEMEGASTVLDFGGGCGRHYKEANSPSVRWAVVETPAMVARANELETGQLKFFTSIELAAEWLGDVEIVHSNGALQYIQNPIRAIESLIALQPQRLLWYRLLLGDGKRETQISRLGDNGPGRFVKSIKNVAVDRTTIKEFEFLKPHAGYQLVERGPDWFKFVR